MGTAKPAEIDLLKSFLVGEIEHGERVIRAAAVVRYVGGRTVGGSNDFVRIVADGKFAEDFESCGIDDGQGVIGFGQDEEGFARNGLRGDGCCESDRRNQKSCDTESAFGRHGHLEEPAGKRLESITRQITTEKI